MYDVQDNIYFVEAEMMGRVSWIKRVPLRLVVELEQPAALGVLHAQLGVDEGLAEVDVEHALGRRGGGGGDGRARARVARRQRPVL